MAAGTLECGAPEEYPRSGRASQAHYHLAVIELPGADGSYDAGMGVDQLEVAIGQYDFRRGLQRLDGGAHAPWQEQVVGAEITENLAPCHRPSPVEGVCLAGIRLSLPM